MESDFHVDGIDHYREQTAPLQAAALEAEYRLIGSIIMVNHWFGLIKDEVRREYFFQTAHRHVWSAICELAEDGKPIDDVSIFCWLKESGLDSLIPPMDVIEYTTMRVDGRGRVMIPALARTYARLVREGWQAREVMRIAGELMENAQGKALTPQAALARAMEQMEALSMQDALGLSSGEAERDGLTDYLDAPRPGRSLGIPGAGRFYGHRIQEGVIAIVGRPKVGKTQLALHLAARAAEQGQKVLYCFTEQNVEWYMKRWAARELKIPMDHVFTPEDPYHPGEWRLSPEQRRRIKNYLNEWKCGETVHLKSISGRGLDYIIPMIADQYHSSGPYGLVIIDHVSGIKRRDRQGEYEFHTEAAPLFRETAVKLRVPTICFQQPTTGEDRAGWVSTRGRGGNAWAQEALFVASLNFIKQIDGENLLDFEVADTRCGEPGAVGLMMNPAIGAFKRANMDIWKAEKINCDRYKRFLQGER